MRCGSAIGALLVVAGCGASGPAEEPANAEHSERATVFDPLVQSLERAEGVQQSVDDRAAEQRRRLEEAER